MGLCTSAFNLWRQPCQAPCKETAGSGIPALELETELLKLINHHLCNLNQLFISESHTKCESFLPNVMYFHFIFITVKIVCITLLLKINNFKVNLYAKTCIPL